MANDPYIQTLRKDCPGVEFVKEFQFHPTRKWRFDYAAPSLRVAIEIDGAVWKYGRHNNPAGYIADLEKLNTAASLGWLVLRFTTGQRFNTASRLLVAATIGRRMDEAAEGES